MQPLNLTILEHELKKCLAFPYRWHAIQDDLRDHKTGFIYHCRSWNQLNEHLSKLDTNLQDYSRNRWLNFWSAMAVEQIFSLHPKVIPAPNSKDKLVDFFIDGIPFDLKTTVFPRFYDASIEEAMIDPHQLITWLYENQSRQGRRHFANRLFIVLYDSSGRDHWKLKTEIEFLKSKIESYLHAFHADQFYRLTIDGFQIQSDIIWCIR